ncbi:putative transposase, Ptta/En/Spm, plant [Sesbania bispinosa]|nr:putative transposase, Ptta/En/Spm, plant [Sesbania bispinosa]
MNRGRRVDDIPPDIGTPQTSSIYPQLGRPVGSSSTFTLTPIEKIQGHRYLLLNCPLVKPYIEAFIKRKNRARRPSATEIEKIVTKEFATWFPQRVTNPNIANSIPEEIKFLAKGPMPHAKRYTAYNINGFKFRTIDRDEGLKTQNNGVFLTSNTLCVASSVDANVQQADLPYYGKLEDIIELNYYGLFKVVLFKCKWADTTHERGFRKDAWQFTSVNFSRCIHTGEREEHDPYIEASQAQLVYYVDDEVNKGWSVIVHMKPRDLYDMGQVIEDDICENMPLTRVLQFKRPKSGAAISAPTIVPQIPIPPLGSTSHAPSHSFAPTQQPRDIPPPKGKRPKSGAAISAPTRVPQIPIPQLGSTSHAPSHSFAPTQQPQDFPPPKCKRPKSGAAISAPTRVPHIPIPPLGSTSHAPSHSFAPNQQPKDMPQASSQKHSIPMEPPQTPLEATPPQASIPSYAGHEQGNQKEIQLRISGVFDMPKGQRIIVPFDRQLRACGEAAVLLSGACGHIATEPNNIPINYESWAAVPYSYKKDCLETLKNLFHFQASDLIVERYCLLTMGRKYRNFKLNLWNMNFDPLYSREQLIHNVPDGIPKDQWSSLVDYRLKPDYQELCRRNAEARKKQTIPHTGGSKLLSRKQHEMEMEVGRVVSRGELYIATHKKKDGSYVNEEARSIVEYLVMVLCLVYDWYP